MLTCSFHVTIQNLLGDHNVGVAADGDLLVNTGALLRRFIKNSLHVARVSAMPRDMHCATLQVRPVQFSVAIVCGMIAHCLNQEQVCCVLLNSSCCRACTFLY